MASLVPPMGLNQLVLGPDDPGIYGVDILWQPDLDPMGALIYGRAVLVQDLMHRQMTKRGSLAFHPNDGIYLLGFLNSSFNLDDPKQLVAINAKIEIELKKDERVQDCTVSSVYTADTETLQLNELVTPYSQGPFSMILAVNGQTMTLSLLGIEV